jgi:Mlc titration factor MtfA (ptsG expression regulator)
MQVCVLVLSLPLRIDEYVGWVTVILRPTALVMYDRTCDGAAVCEDERPISGVASSLGSIVQAWQETARGFRDGAYAYNVEIDEFGRKLDMLDRTTNGPPARRRGIDH